MNPRSHSQDLGFQSGRSVVGHKQPCADPSIRPGLELKKLGCGVRLSILSSAIVPFRVRA